jgi:uncharacterized membrane protein YeaQ/YmgE (transglycosylase-associated protein family)
VALLGWIGAAVAGFVGAWLMVDVLHIVILLTLAIEGLSIVSAILGAMIVVVLFSLVAGRMEVAAVGAGEGLTPATPSSEGQLREGPVDSVRLVAR